MTTHVRSEAAQYGTTLVIVLSLNQKLIAPLTVDEVSASFKKSLNFDTKNLYVALKGMASLAPKFKKLCKTFEEQSQEFYREKRNRLKKKLSLREKMPTTIYATPFKQHTKIAFLYEMVHNRTAALEHFKLAYNSFTALLGNLLKMFDVWEVKAVGDALEGKLARYYLAANEAKQIVTLFCSHYPLFKQKPTEVDPRLLYIEYKWRAEQLKRQAGFLQNDILPTDPLKKKEVTMWLSFLHFVFLCFLKVTGSENPFHDRRLLKC